MPAALARAACLSAAPRSQPAQDGTAHEASAASEVSGLQRRPRSRHWQPSRSPAHAATPGLRAYASSHARSACLSAAPPPLERDRRTRWPNARNDSDGDSDGDSDSDGDGDGDGDERRRRAMVIDGELSARPRLARPACRDRRRPRGGRHRGAGARRAVPPNAPRPHPLTRSRGPGPPPGPSALAVAPRHRSSPSALAVVIGPRRRHRPSPSPSPSSSPLAVVIGPSPSPLAVAHRRRASPSRSRCAMPAALARAAGTAAAAWRTRRASGGGGDVATRAATASTPSNFPTCAVGDP